MVISCTSSEFLTRVHCLFFSSQAPNYARGIARLSFIHIVFYCFSFRFRILFLSVGFIFIVLSSVVAYTFALRGLYGLNSLYTVITCAYYVRALGRLGLVRLSFFHLFCLFRVFNKRSCIGDICAL